MPKPIDNRLAWRCRRGLLELDLWLGGFLRAHRATLIVQELIAFERLLERPDMEILEYLQGKPPENDQVMADLIKRIQVYRVPADEEDSHAQL